ncbi:hypothetical protein HYY71_07020 [Candidatus Woesearchaeota archaeon]|nr:hypothetical protein [Candidatus Woesearchaeota archaeon]
MSETTFEKQILDKLNRVEKTMSQILEYMADSKLSEDDKKAIDETLKAEKLGKLKSMKEVFG